MKEIDWSNLSFGYMKTDYNVRINFLLVRASYTIVRQPSSELM